MATVVTLETAREGYPALVHAVRQFGTSRAPRGLPTLDVGHYVVEVRSPYDALPLDVGRSLNPAIGAGEAVQLVAGRADHELLPRITPAFTRYYDPGTARFHGAYGDRIGDQVGSAVRKLQKDYDTRQAVVTLWDPLRDNDSGHLDYPCTVALNFVVVDGLLELRTLMRSNDVWRGFPYDVFQFTQLQLTVARALGVEPGRYTHETWSLHLYLSDAELVDKLHLPTAPGPYQPSGFGLVGDCWTDCRWRAGLVLTGDRPHELRGPFTESELWYVKQLAPYKV